jgi:peroxiredoxin
MIEVGTKAPEFSLPNQDGKEVALSDYPHASRMR